MVISSRKNESVRLFRKLAGDKAFRDERGLFAIEGDHLCREAEASGIKTVLVLATEKARVKYPGFFDAYKGETAVISEDIAEYISDTKTPQGLFAVAEKNTPESFYSDRLLLLDGVQDPGNVGTMLRTAEALGLGGAVLSPDCADIYSPKTLRASMGSVFRFPCIIRPPAETITKLRADGFEVWGAVLDSSARRLNGMVFPQKCAVVIGSEGNGLSSEVRSACTGGIYIPISRSESLNAASAGAIFCWEMMKDPKSEG